MGGIVLLLEPTDHGHNAVADDEPLHGDGNTLQRNEHGLALHVNARSSAACRSRPRCVSTCRATFRNNAVKKGTEAARTIALSAGEQVVAPETGDEHISHGAIEIVQARRISPARGEIDADNRLITLGEGDALGRAACRRRGDDDPAGGFLGGHGQVTAPASLTAKDSSPQDLPSALPRHWPPCSPKP
jgi:hypothetical protein